ncbi:MAG: hypothetical protein HY942_09365 [Gammaproteobacteria bacterium]|nr:hypothetical protein [Gammaproteobacteria bacterium]
MSEMKRRVFVLCAMLAVAGGSLFAPVHAADPKPVGRVPSPTVKIEKGEKCVEPTDVIRRDHMKFILHQRDETMHRGIRTTKHSLKNCIDCHADPKTNSVLGKDGFCESCHRYAAVSMDCFECHSPAPRKQTGGANTSAAHAPGSAP